MEQQISYCTATDGARIAYATYGNDDAAPLVFIPDIPNQEATWGAAWGRAFLVELARRRRLITLDPRGFGASQRDGDCSPAAQAADVAVVADHLRLERYELCAGGWVPSTWAIVHAAARPNDVSKLVLFSPRVASSAAIVSTAESIRASYWIFLRSLATIFFPSGPPEVQRWFSAATRASVDADAFSTTIDWTYDLAPILSRLAVPTLILHRKGCQVSDLAQVRSAATLIPNARLVAVDGDAGALYWDYEQVIETLYDFLGVRDAATSPGTPSAAAVTQNSSPSGDTGDARHGIAVILFADIVDSTALTERMGNAQFRDRSRALEETLRSIIRAHGGLPVDGRTLGDGVLGVFSSATQGIEAAAMCAAQAATTGFALHLGLHAGDVIREGGNVHGIAVSLASRVSALTAPNEILVSQTVRDLARASADVAFEDRGEHMLKGIDDPVRVFAVRSERAR